MLPLCLFLAQDFWLKPELFRPLGAQVIRVQLEGARPNEVTQGRLIAGWRSHAFEDLRVEKGVAVADVMGPREAGSFVLAARAGMRFAKAIGYTGAPASGFDTVVGFALELVPNVNPYGLKAGGKLPVRVVARGRPRPGVVLSWSRERRGQTTSGTLVSDGSGVVWLPLTGPGLWRLSAAAVPYRSTLIFEFEEDRP